MKITKNIIWVLFVVLACVVFVYVFSVRNKTDLLINDPTPADTSVVYRNTAYGFTFALPESWRGYSIVNTAWEGNPLKNTSTKESGPKLLVRNPKWTATLPYEDIPVMVFTLAQWNAYIAENFSVSAAPILATELGRNTVYVFALPPRWNFDYSEGYEEAENIVKSNSLEAFTI